MRFSAWERPKGSSTILIRIIQPKSTPKLPLTHFQKSNPLPLSPLFPPTHCINPPITPGLRGNLFTHSSSQKIPRKSITSFSLYKTTLLPSKPLTKPLFKPRNSVLDHQPTTHIIEFTPNTSQTTHNRPPQSPESSSNSQAFPKGSKNVKTSLFWFI